MNNRTTPTESETETGQTRSGFVALIGAPNAGKSTLVNQLVGTKVSIVTHKVQTTRALVRGIFIEGPAQIVLVDTPGIFRPKRRLDRAMVTTAWGGAKDADIILVLLDAQGGLNENAEALLESMKNVRQKKVLVLNKVDRVDPPVLLTLAQKANELVTFDQTFMISALNGSGCKDLAKSPARSFICACMKSCLTHRRWKRNAGKSARTVRFASNRSSMSSAKARRRSFSATRARP
jgi:GTP-binding protein Era